MEDLLEGFEFEVRGPYLIYRKPSQEVHGIWFYDENECQELINLFCRYITLFLSYSELPFTFLDWYFKFISSAVFFSMRHDVLYLKILSS